MTASKKQPMSEGELRERIQDAGLRVTLPRIQILKTLVQNEGHHSIDAIHNALKGRDIMLPRASVYNAMYKFIEAGLAQSLTIKGRILYEIASEPHAHFVCRRCEKIDNVYQVKSNISSVEKQLPDYLVDEAQTIARGFCPTCRPLVEEELKADTI